MGIYNDPQYFEKRIKYQRKRRSAVISAIRAHFIRPCYLRESEAPMKFYKLIARIGLPLGFILNLFRAMQATAAIGTATESARPYFIIDAVYMWVGIVLLFGAIVGLNKMKWAGVKYYASLFGWQIVYSVFLATYSASLELFEFEYFGRNIFAAIFLSVWLYFCMIYFGKRRLLFSPGAFETPRVADEAKTEPEKVAPVQPEPTPVLQEAPPEPAVDLPPTVQKSPPADLVAVKKTKRRPNIPVIVLCIALVLSLAGNVWQGVMRNAERKEFDSELKGKDQAFYNLKSANTSLKSEISDLETYRADTYYTTGYIVSGSNYYHRYDCPVFEAANTYQSHNTKFCEWLGYSACPVCKSGFLINFNSKMPQQSAP
jgi:hypothetical protein